jgi:hypothetical protein
MPASPKMTVNFPENLRQRIWASIHSSKKGLPNLILGKEFEQPFTKKDPIFNRKVLDFKISRSLDHTPSSQSIFYFPIILLPKNLD